MVLKPEWCKKLFTIVARHVSTLFAVPYNSIPAIVHANLEPKDPSVNLGSTFPLPFFLYLLNYNTIIFSSLFMLFVNKSFSITTIITCDKYSNLYLHFTLIHASTTGSATLVAVEGFL